MRRRRIQERKRMEKGKNLEGKKGWRRGKNPEGEKKGGE